MIKMNAVTIIWMGCIGALLRWSNSWLDSWTEKKGWTNFRWRSWGSNLLWWESSCRLVWWWCFGDWAQTPLISLNICYYKQTNHEQKKVTKVTIPWKKSRKRMSNIIEYIFKMVYHHYCTHLIINKLLIGYFSFIMIVYYH